MGACDAGMPGNIGLRRVEQDDRQAIVERGVGLARILDQLDRAVPNRPNRARVADRNEWRKREGRPVIPAFGDDLRADPRGIAEGYRKRWERRACHQPRLLTNITA